MSAAIVVVCMPERGHLQRLLPLIAALAARGRAVHVMTDAGFAPDVARAGARPLDLFARCPLDAADATSIPVPSRYVSFAATYAETVTAEIAALAPAVVVYDTFAVIAPLVARRLGVPYVNVCAGHAALPARAVARLRNDPRVATSDACHAAVRRLREVYGMTGASPFSYVDGVSPYLNLYCEPPQFLDAADRQALEPLAFFGSLPAEAGKVADSAAATGARGDLRHRRCGGGSTPPRISPARLRVYVSFGTVIWRYYARAAYTAFGVLADALAGLDAEVVMSLGRHDLEAGRRAALARPHLRVESYVDQWTVLQACDVFVTHHGLNSTHEAIFHRVPMLSYPFFDDQPGLALRCQELGLALPLGAEPRTPLAADAVARATRRLVDERDAFAARLAEARAWELATIAARPAVIDRLLALS